MTAPDGAEVGLYVDLAELVHIGHVIQTRTGRRYGVVSVRVQQRGVHAGRQHLRCLVLDREEALEPGTKVHRIYWYKRARRAGRRK